MLPLCGVIYCHALQKDAHVSIPQHPVSLTGHKGVCRMLTNTVSARWEQAEPRAALYLNML